MPMFYDFMFKRIFGSMHARSVASHNKVFLIAPSQILGVRSTFPSQTVCLEMISGLQPEFGSPVSKYSDPPCTMTQSHPYVELARQGDVIPGFRCVYLCVVLYIRVCAHQKFPDRNKARGRLTSTLVPAILSYFPESGGVGMESQQSPGQRGYSALGGVRERGTEGFLQQPDLRGAGRGRGGSLGREGRVPLYKWVSREAAAFPSRKQPAVGHCVFPPPSLSVGSLLAPKQALLIRTKIKK